MIQQVPPSLPLLSNRLREEVNRLRSDPRSFVDYLTNKLRFYRDTLYFLEDRPESAIRTSQGDRAPRQLIDQLSKMQPLPPIEHSEVLQKAAERHARDLGNTGKYSHEGSDGSNFEERVGRYGVWRGHLVEMLECGYREPRDILASLLIDDAHRKTLLNPDVHFEGICIHTHSVYEYITVMVFSSEVPTIEQDQPPARVTAEIFPSKANRLSSGTKEEAAWQPNSRSLKEPPMMEGANQTEGKGHCECTMF